MTLGEKLICVLDEMRSRSVGSDGVTVRSTCDHAWRCGTRNFPLCATISARLQKKPCGNVSPPEKTRSIPRLDSNLPLAERGVAPRSNCGIVPVPAIPTPRATASRPAFPSAFVDLFPGTADSFLTAHDVFLYERSGDKSCLAPRQSQRPRNRSKPARIFAARISPAQSWPSGFTHRHYRRSLGHGRRRYHQRRRCLHQLSPPQAGRWHRSSVDSHRARRRLPDRWQPPSRLSAPTRTLLLRLHARLVCGIEHLPENSIGILEA
jgi:hypothetical protein